MPRYPAVERQSVYARRRISLGLTQASIADLAQISIYTYCAIERGTRQASPNEALRLMNVLDHLEEAFDTARHNATRARLARGTVAS
jgi:transcriptional regulator with XRE-family HTH domain